MIVLQTYGRIEGVLMAGREPWAKVSILLSRPRAGFGGMTYDFTKYWVETDEHGRFTFENVPPGEHRIMRLKQTSPNSGRYMQHATPVVVKPGETTRVVIGGEHARSVVGRAVFDLPGAEINWEERADGSLSTKTPDPPDDVRANPDSYRAWLKRPEMVEARNSARNYQVDFSADGTFRVEDIQPGTYHFSLYVYPRDADDLTMSVRHAIGSYTTELTIPESGALSHNIGTIVLKPTPAAQRKR